MDAVVRRNRVVRLDIHGDDLTIDERMVSDPLMASVFGGPLSHPDRSSARSHLAAWLVDPGRGFEAVAATRLRHITACGGRTMDDVTIPQVEMAAELISALRTLGIDPRAFAVAVVYHPATDYGLDGHLFEPTFDTHPGSGRPPRVTARIHLADHVDINPVNRTVTIRGTLPDTVRDAVVGMPLHEVVGHRLVADVDSRILRVETSADETRIVYRTPGLVTIRELTLQRGERG